jgi:tRNA pseudouridine55 synthase
MRVSKGTYIRTIAEDIGRVLGCGGHVAALRRLSVSGFASEGMVPMSVLEAEENLDDYLYPLALAFSHYPHWVCTAPEIALLHQGRLILVNGIAQKSGHIALLDVNKTFVGLGELKGRVVEPRCMV